MVMAAEVQAILIVALIQHLDMLNVKLFKFKTICFRNFWSVFTFKEREKNLNLL